MSTIPMVTPSEIWNNILKGNVGKDDPLWKEYLDKAAVFDARMVDELNKIVDVLLVYVALFISVLTSFIIQTFTQFQRNPADITNDLLVAIYSQLVAQSTNTSIPPVDPRSYFNQSKADYDAAVIQNALLYTSLSLSFTVSAIALSAKLWLVNYSRQVFSVGSPYDRAMKRQEAYNGVLVWNLEGVINVLPVILVIALFLFDLYIYWSVSVPIIGFIVGVLVNVGVLFLCFASFGGAFVSGCPFHSSFSSVARSSFEKLQTLLKWILCGRLSSEWLRKPWIRALASWGSAASMVTVYAVTSTDFWPTLTILTPIIPMAFFAQLEVVHKPQKYKISHLALWMFLSVSVLMILNIWTDGVLISLFLFIIGEGDIALAICISSEMSKSMADTGEIDAIAWLLTTAPPQYPAAFFKKAGQMTGFDSIGCHYRARLLESLMPFLTLLITSHRAPEQPSSDTHSPSSSLSFDDSKDPQLKNLEIYIACLARLSEFTDYEGRLWCLREDARQHPKLEQPLIDKLVVFADPRRHFQDGLRSAATKVLNNYELDIEGNIAKSPAGATVVQEWSIATFLRSAPSLILNVGSGSNLNSQEDLDRQRNFRRPMGLATRLEPPHAFGEIEEA